MQILINTQNSLEGKESFINWAVAEIEDRLGRFKGRVSRVEVHLSDENADKVSENDKRCTMEARVEGRSPVAVTHHASTVADALTGASTKMKKSLDRIIEKNDQRKGNTPIGGEPFGDATKRIDADSDFDDFDQDEQ
jgi:ribosome-associated translation inhibitor RaiA